MTQKTTKRAASTEEIKRYRSNFRDEVDGRALYTFLAEAEKNVQLKAVYTQLAAAEGKHLALWRRKLEEAGEPAPGEQPSLRIRMLGWLARRFGTETVAPIARRMEMSAVGVYDDQPEAVAEGLPASERSHALVFGEIARSGGSSGSAIARLEGRHRMASGNALRAAVLGANDGLVSNFGLVMGMAGADPGRDVVALTGIAGLLAGSLSMALGEWISVRSSAEAFERQIEVERMELEMAPEEEEEELALIYQAKGLREDIARAAAKRIISDKATALDTLVREELGMSPEEVGNAWVAAGTSFGTFAGGAVLPVIPWLFIGGETGLALSAAASGLGLFGTGAITSLFTGRPMAFSGARMLTFGAVMAAITFAIGRLIGVSAG